MRHVALLSMSSISLIAGNIYSVTNSTDVSAPPLCLGTVCFSQVVMASWTSTVSFTGVSVSGEFGADPSTSFTAFLMTSVGPGTTSADQIASVTVTPPSSDSRSLTLFTGLNLGPGTYFLVLCGPATSSLAFWYQYTSPLVSTATGVGAGTFGVANAVDALSEPDSIYPPESSFDTTNPLFLSIQIATSDLSQTITFESLSNQAFGATPPPLRAAASSGLPVTFTSDTPAVCSVSGANIALVSTGTCSITASQPGNSTYLAASPVVQSFTVTQGSQTISFSALPNLGFGSAPSSLTATATSGLPVAFASTTPAVCNVSGVTAMIVAAGTCSIMASQAGNSNYAAAAPVVQSFPVTLPSQLIWTLNAIFADGGTASGFFAFDPVARIFSAWDVSATGGNEGVFPPFEFTPSNSSLSFDPNDTNGLTIEFVSSVPATTSGGASPGNLVLGAALASPLSGGGATINVAPGVLSRECFDCNPSRGIASGVVTAGYRVPWIYPAGIVPVGSEVTTIEAGEWVSIYGANLAGSTAVWNGTFATSLNGTEVTINGKAAYPSFVSPAQINVQAPDDTATGQVPIVVTTDRGSFISTITLAEVAPSFSLLDSQHVAGIILRLDGSGAYGGGTYDIIGPTGNSLGYPTVAAKAGDIVELFGTGFGPTDPAVPAGQAFSGSAPTTQPVGLFINNISVTPSFAGLSSTGLDQINFIVPAGLGTGDVPLVATVGGGQTPSTVVISLQ